MATTDVERDGRTVADILGAGDPEGDDGAQMTLIEHLTELRSRLFYSILAIVIGSIIGFIFYEPILHFLLLPLPREANLLTPKNGDTTKLVVTQIGEGFTVAFKLALAVGIALSTPVWLYQVWAFISPALTRKEKKHALPFVLIGVVLFVLGISVGFLTLRYPISFLVDFGGNSFVHLISADSYFSFTAFFLLAFGLVFELPLVMTFLAVLGIISSEFLAKNRAYILTGLWIASCFITPGADPYSPVILGIAFTFLYFVSEGLIRIIKK